MAKRNKKQSKSLLKVESLEQRQLLAGGFTEAQGQEFSDIVHANGNVYDQVLLKSSAITVTNDPGQITRVSFLDVDGDIVQAEFSGAGSLTISLDPDTYSGPAEAANYNQPGVLYVKGLASFTIQGSDASTNFSVFTVGTLTAHNGVNNPIFADGKLGGDHISDVQRLTIVADPSNPNGSTFGGIRASNAVFSASSGVVGITAANVHVQNIVRIGDIDAMGSATPALIFGQDSQFGSVDVGGGDLLSTNGKAINNNNSYGYDVSLLAGTDSSGTTIAAKDTYSQIIFTGANPVSTAPKTLTLTTGADTGVSFTGGSGNDSYIALTSTLTVGDTLNGGDGTDTLSLTSVLGADTTVSGFTSTSIENYNVNFSDSAAGTAHTLTLDLQNAAGVTHLMASGTTAAAALSDTVVFNNVNAGAALTVSNATNLNVTANYVAGATSGSADVANLTLNSVTGTATTDAVVTISNGFETLNVTTGGGASTLGALNYDGGTLNISGTANLQVRTALDDDTKTIDASGMSGNVTLTLGNKANVYTGGSGKDVITTGAGAVNESINLGAGDDTVTFTGNLTVDDTLTGGDGTDTLQVNNAQASAGTTFTKITGFETLAISDGSTGTVAVEKFQAGINRVNLMAATAGNTTLNMGAGAQTVGLGAGITGGNTLTVDASGSGTSDSLTITNTQTSGNIGSVTSGLTVTDFENVTLNTGSYSAHAAQDLQTVNIGSGNALTLTGSNALNLAGGFTGASIDASGMTGSDAKLTMNAAATSVSSITGTANADTIRGDASSNLDGGAGNDSIFGGSGNDTIAGGAGNDSIVGNGGNDVITGGDGADSIDVSAAAGNVNVNGGAGNDSIILNGTLTASDTINGGDGTDTLHVNATDVSNVNGLSFTDGLSLIENLSNIERISFGALATSGTPANIVDMTRFDNIPYVILTADGAAETRINGLAEGATVQLSSLLGAGDNLTLALASTSGTNTINIVSTVSGGDDALADIVTVSGVENVNYSSMDTDDGAVRTNTVNFSLTDVTTLTVTGNAIADIDGLAIGATNIDASGNTEGVRVLGNFLAQTFTGTAKADSIQAGGGADTINAGDGADTIDAGTGSDVVNGQGGNDSIDGGAGLDTIDGGAGNDTINGGTENDSITGGEGADVIDGGAGTDTIVLTESTAARDRVIVGNGESTVANPDIVVGFDTGSGTNDDVINLGSALAANIAASNGEQVSNGRFTYDGDPVDLNSVINLLQTLARNDAGDAVDNGVVFFEFEGNTYVAELTGADGAETVTDLVMLQGVTGMNTITNAGGNDMLISKV